MMPLILSDHIFYWQNIFHIAQQGAGSLSSGHVRCWSHWQISHKWAWTPRNSRVVQPLSEEEPSNHHVFWIWKEGTSSLWGLIMGSNPMMGSCYNMYLIVFKYMHPMLGSNPIMGSCYNMYLIYLNIRTQWWGQTLWWGPVTTCISLYFESNHMGSCYLLN